LPGFRVTDTVLVPPWNTGVLPTTVPELVAIVMSCISGALLVNLSVSFPAFAVSELWVNFSAPLGSAELVMVFPPPLGAAAAELELLDVAAGALEDEPAAVLLELLDPPQAARPSASRTTPIAKPRILCIGRSPDVYEKSVIPALQAPAYRIGGRG
jgi:hypothetical protein